MSSVIKLKHNDTAAAVPADGQLAKAEIAINLADKKLYSSTNGTDIITVSGATADTLTAPRNIAVSGAVSGTASFDGSADVTISTTIADSITANTSGNAGTATALASGQNFSLTGDVTATAVSFDGSGAVELTTVIAENSVALGTDTTGNYMSGVSGTANEIEVTHTPSEGSTATIGLPDDVTIGNDLDVTRDLTVTRNLHVDGNMTIEGSQTYISSSTVTIDDSALKLGANNAADTLDTGVYGLYVDGATNKYAGYFRDASDSGKFKFYTGLQTEPTGTVDPAATGYAMGEVVAIIDGGTYST
ncbi:hypothetical protein N9J18_00825 [Porticoccaceae bacterium]|nr:hypothetical protein [Porticoccaceae bacterium]